MTRNSLLYLWRMWRDLDSEVIGEEVPRILCCRLPCEMTCVLRTLVPQLCCVHNRYISVNSGDPSFSKITILHLYCKPVYDLSLKHDQHD